MTRKKFDLEAAIAQEEAAAKAFREEQEEKVCYNEYLLACAHDKYASLKESRGEREGQVMRSDQIKALCAIMSEELFQIKKHLGIGLY